MLPGAPFKGKHRQSPSPVKCWAAYDMLFTLHCCYTCSRLVPCVVTISQFCSLSISITLRQTVSTTVQVLSFQFQWRTIAASAILEDGKVIAFTLMWFVSKWTLILSNCRVFIATFHFNWWVKKAFYFCRVITKIYEAHDMLRLIFMWCVTF